MSCESGPAISTRDSGVFLSAEHYPIRIHCTDFLRYPYDHVLSRLVAAPANFFRFYAVLISLPLAWLKWTRRKLEALDLRIKEMGKSYSELDEARECAARDPHRALQLENRYIEANPSEAAGYFSRHFTWAKLGHHDRALADCSKAIGIQPNLYRYLARAEIYRALGDYPHALADLDHVRDADHEIWLTSFGPHLRADTLARLGRLDEALADAALIRDDHWMPEHSGLPGGSKQEFVTEVTRRAMNAKPPTR